jgi:hypothetical protein
VKQVFWAAAGPPCIAVIAVLLVNRRADKFKIF